MGFFSWLFGHKNTIETVEIEDTSEVFESEPKVEDTPIVIEPIDQKSIDVDFQMEVVVEGDKFVVKATVEVPTVRECIRRNSIQSTRLMTTSAHPQPELSTGSIKGSPSIRL